MEGLLGLEALGPWGTKVSEEGGVVHYHPISPFTSLPLPSPCSGGGRPSPSPGPALPRFPVCVEGSSWAVGLGVGNRLEIQWEGYRLDSKKNFLPFQGRRASGTLFTRKSHLEHPGSGKRWGQGVVVRTPQQSHEEGGVGPRVRSSESTGRVLMSVLSQEERGRASANELLPKFSVREWAAPRGGSFLTRCPWALPLPPQELKPPKVRGI